MAAHLRRMPLRFPPRRILVPMESSDASRAAWEEASRLARRFGARLEAAYVRQPVLVMLGPGMDIPEPGIEARIDADAMASVRAKIGPRIQLHQLRGPTDEAVASYAARQGFDLIVMGTHGRTGLERLLTGSVAEAVVRRSRVPVLVARAALRPRAVLAPVAGRPGDERGLLAAAQVAAAFGARLGVLHVFEAPVTAAADELSGARQMLGGLIGRLPQGLRVACRPEPKLALGDPAREIAAASREDGITVLVARTKGLLQETLLGTTAERVIRHARGAILAIPPRL